MSESGISPELVQSAGQQQDDEGLEILWRPWPGMQTEAIAAREYELFIGGAKGPGKSDCVIMKATAQVDRPRYKALILRQSFPEAQELIDRTHRIFPRLEDPPSWNGELRRWAFPSGAVIQVGYCSSPEDVQRYHGQEWSYIGFDELADVPDERVWMLLMAECRCPDPAVFRQMVGSGNPGKPGHAWVKRRFVDKCGRAGERVWRELYTNPFTGEVFELTRRYIPGRVTDNPVYANDPLYIAQLLSLPETLRRQLLYGDWDAGYGMALDELDSSVHLVEPFDVPAHWVKFGSFDWGYTHPWVFTVYAVNEDGRVYQLDTVRGRRMKDPEIVERIKHRVPYWRQLRYVVAGHDCWSNYRAHRADGTPSTEERFRAEGIPLTKANVARSAGLANLRHYLAWKGIGPHGEDWEPALVFFDTPGNRWCFEMLQSMTIDPDNMEDVLKVDADPISGEGGDDAYDAVRYALASRPPRALAFYGQELVRAWSPAVLRWEYEYTRRRGPVIQGRRVEMFGGDFYEFGVEF